MTLEGIPPLFTLGSKYAEVTGRDASKLLHPLMKDHIAYRQKSFETTTRVVKPSEVYPGLGMTQSHKAIPGSDPPYPVCGPSQPQCGSRATNKDNDPFPGLSLEMVRAPPAE